MVTSSVRSYMNESGETFAKSSAFSARSADSAFCAIEGERSLVCWSDFDSKPFGRRTRRCGVTSTSLGSENNGMRMRMRIQRSTASLRVTVRRRWRWCAEEGYLSAICRRFISDSFATPECGVHESRLWLQGSCSCSRPQSQLLKWVDLLFFSFSIANVTSSGVKHTKFLVELIRSLRNGRSSNRYTYQIAWDDFP